MLGGSLRVPPGSEARYGAYSRATTGRDGSVGVTLDVGLTAVSMYADDTDWAGRRAPDTALCHLLYDGFVKVFLALFCLLRGHDALVAVHIDDD